MKRRIENIEGVPLAALLDVSFLLLFYFVLMQNDVKDESYVAVNAPSPGTQPTSPVVTLDIVVMSDAYLCHGEEFKQVGQMNEVLSFFEQNSLPDPDDEKRLGTIVNLKISTKGTQEHLIALIDELAKRRLTNIKFFYLKDQMAR